MNFTDSINVCFNKYADFEGRAKRSEFWWFVLFLCIGSGICHLLSWTIGSIFGLATFIPSIAVAARRLHDIDRSGWWQLFGFVPVAGWIVLLIFYVQEGTASPNRFDGAAPQEPSP